MWQWAVQQIPERVTDPAWKHLGLIGGIIEACPTSLQRMSCRRSPAAHSCDVYGHLRSVAYHSLIYRPLPPREPLLVLDGRLRPFWGVVARNMDRVCRRFLRSELVQGYIDVGPITLDGGATLHATSDYGDAPALPSGALAIQSPL